MTAGHICHGKEHQLDRMEATFAEHDRTKSDKGEFRLVPDKMVIHPQFDIATLENDVCMLFFRDIGSFVKAAGTVSHACLPPMGSVVPDGTRCWVAGWGSQSETTIAQSNKLHEIAVAYIGTKMCNSEKIYDSELHIHSMVCAGSLDGAVDACVGDSGSPLICAEKGAPVIRGTVSWGIGCARSGFPGVYAHTSKLASWIMDQTSQEIAEDTGIAEEAPVLLPGNLVCKHRKLGHLAPTQEQLDKEKQIRNPLSKVLSAVSRIILT